MFEEIELCTYLVRGIVHSLLLKLYRFHQHMKKRNKEKLLIDAILNSHEKLF